MAPGRAGTGLWPRPPVPWPAIAARSAGKVWVPQRPCRSSGVNQPPIILGGAGRAGKGIMAPPSRPCPSGQNLTEGSLGCGPHPWNISRIYAANRMRWTQPCMTFAWPLAKVTIETPSVTISSHSSVCSTPRISGWPVR